MADDRAVALNVIDATLAGDPVDPEHAELAELSLFLRAERPVLDTGTARALDQRVESRFARAPARKRRRLTARWWAWAPAGGLAAAVIVVAVVGASSGNSSSGTSASSSASGSVASKSAPRPEPPAPAHSPARQRLAAAAPGRSSTNGASPFPGLTVVPNGRKIVHGAQLSIAAPPRRIEDVAQELFNVVGAQKGFVLSSTVTAGGTPAGYAQFQLSLPTATLSQTMSELSELQYADVVSRTDTTNDITSQFTSANQQLGESEALRTSLLKQLQNAVTQTQISSLRAQLHDVDAKIARLNATRRSLNHQVSYSQVSVALQARTAGAATGGGFTLGKAAGDAAHVLEVAAGVALIALAVALPVALLAALAYWIAAALRRRRREQALDLA